MRLERIVPACYTTWPWNGEPAETRILKKQGLSLPCLPIASQAHVETERIELSAVRGLNPLRLPVPPRLRVEPSSSDDLLTCGLQIRCSTNMS